MGDAPEAASSHNSRTIQILWARQDQTSAVDDLLCLLVLCRT